MNLVFWNMNEKKLGRELRELTLAYDLDILILAECPLSDVGVLEAVNSGSGPTFEVPFNLSSKLRFYTRFARRAFKSLADDAGIAVRRVLSPIGGEVILAAVHLPSKLHSSGTDQTLLQVRMRTIIEEAEARVGHDRTIVIGDFNMNPFEDGLVAADALHSVMDRRTAEELGRRVQNCYRKFFFNPMWSRLGDSTLGPPGTYYYRNTGQVSFFWNTFDQVLLRPSLLRDFADKDVEVITRVNGIDFLNKQGRPDRVRYSDHLPLFIRINIERLATDGN